VMLFLFVAVTTFYFHDFWNLPSGPDKTNNMIHALKNLSMMGAFLMLAAWPRRPVIVETTVPEHVVHDRAEPL
jgi:putative oxidoreductase